MKVLVVDDHMLVRAGLRQVMQAFDDGAFTMLEASSAGAGLAAIGQHPDIDLVLLDLHLPDQSGLEVLAEIGRFCPDLPIVVLSGDMSSEAMQASLALGASGFIPKASIAAVLVSALQLVFAGGVYVPPASLEQTSFPPLLPVRPGARTAAAMFDLTPRQCEVLELLLDGKSNKEICGLLNLAEPTVKNHVSAILHELGVSNRAQAIVAVSRLASVAATFQP